MASPEGPVSRGGASAIGQDYGNLDLGDDADAPLEELEADAPQLTTTARSAGSLYADLDPVDADGDLELDGEVERPEGAAGTVFDGPADVSGLSSKSTGDHPAVDVQLTLPTPPPDEGLPQMAPPTQIPDEAPKGAVIDSAKQLAAAELFKQIAKAVKTLNLYEGRGESCAKAVDQAYRTVKEVLAQHSNILLKVTPYEFLLEGASVYTSKEDRRGMTYRLFRDGVRELELLPPIERDEFAALLEILRRVQPASGEDDTVTQLWEQNLTGVRYKAIDFFLEGMVVSESDDLQAQIDALVEVACRPLHGQEQITVGQEVRAQLTEEIQEQAAAKRQERLAAVRGPGADLDARMVALADEVARMPDDLWRRTSAIILRLMELGRGAGTVGLLVQLIEQMMFEGRWQMLAVSCRSLGEVIEKVGGAGGKSMAAQVLQASLGRLCTDNKLLELEGLLAGCTVSQFNLLAELLRILPGDANPQLIQLLSKTPQGEVQDKFVGVLRDRRVDLTDHYKDRLLSPNIMHVIYAVHDLRAVNLPRALEAIATAADHPSPRVRLEVFRALGESLDEALLPHLISSLVLDHRELRELAFNLLARIKAPALVPKLIQITRQEAYEAWSPTHREHLLGLIVRWGGPESNDFVIRGITAKNPLRRKKIDALREELIAALRRMGGGRSRRLLQACLDSRPSRAVKQSLSEALQAVDARAQRGKQ